MIIGHPIACCDNNRKHFGFKLNAVLQRMSPCMNLMLTICKLLLNVVGLLVVRCCELQSQTGYQVLVGLHGHLSFQHATDAAKLYYTKQVRIRSLVVKGLISIVGKMTRIHPLL